jgi:RimJ/RimL family protein N-acetyltransferase
MIDGTLTFRPVAGETIDDFVTLFLAPGGPKYCWCMVWRRSPAEAKQKDPASRRRQMLQRIGAGTPVGLIAYSNEVAIGWVSIAPRDTHRNLGGPPAREGETIWSLVCFFLPRRMRGQGMVRRLITAAIDYAGENGATVVEAYPVDPDAPSYRFMGFVPVFAEAGFVAVGRAGRRRHVMRLALG